MTGAAVAGTSGALVRVAADIAQDWRRSGLAGGFVARHLDSGSELGFDVHRVLPLASVVKVPIALVVLDRISRGVLDPGCAVELDPVLRTPGPSGLSLFAHPATVAVRDLVTMSLSVSDNAATDALLGLVTPTEVTEQLAAWGHRGLVVRHRIKELHDTVASLPEASSAYLMELAIRGGTPGGGHPIAQLDPARANAGDAAGLAALLADVWTDRIADPRATAELRVALGHQLTRHRFAGELVSDLTTLRSKTGTFLHLRHEAGVCQTSDGDRVVVVALTTSSVNAAEQPEADAAIGAAARAAVEALVDDRYLSGQFDKR
ncbi:serine hydrolase [Microlunatus aurantiacus]|uniref:Serine hydrolase n=1 Tax=Microlunatus aurantiacus TaxID=446786 RepID=A0ABP7D7H9_9ACTN